MRLIVVLILVTLFSCDTQIEDGVMKSDLFKDVEFVTDFGSIIMRLSDETPKHRNNFIKLINQKFYDSLSFHRVIENFIVQTGDPETKNPNSDKEVGETDLPYRIPAEFKPNLLHKRGALNAAREGDNSNQSRASSSTQFTIVQGKTYNDSTLAVAEGRINKWLAYNNVINKPKNNRALEHIQDILKRRENLDSFNLLKEQFEDLAEIELKSMQKYTYPEAHREIYKTIGGAAHLDQNYTVFGEVIQGMNVVDSIAAVQTNETDKPIKDVRIITAKMIKRETYNEN